MGARSPPARICSLVRGDNGAGVNAVATMWDAFAGLTAMLGSLSWLVSPLSEFGIMLTT